jgi:glutamyl-tRNA reductase
MFDNRHDMKGNKSPDISSFFIAGINYRKTDASIRGLFAVGNAQYEAALKLATSYGLQELFILSTCNRTEIYGFAEDAGQLINLLCTQTYGNKEIFTDLAYTKSGWEAVEHLFSVAAGLDSQILGDYEIVSQIKQAVKLSRQEGFMGAFLERLVNCVLQASKSIKNQTALSDGTVSVSFAAVQYIKEKIAITSDKRILLLGTGKIGRTTCKNLITYLGTNNITLINRTGEAAMELAKEVNVHSAPFDQLSACVESSDIILVATNAMYPVLLKSHLQSKSPKLIIDLSIPYNVEPEISDLSHIDLVNLDELSRSTDLTLQKREAEIPRAKSIISEHVREFLLWYEMRKQVPVLKAVKTKLKEIQKSPLFSCNTRTEVSSEICIVDEEKIQRVINGMASKMRKQNQGGCHYIEAINEFMDTGIN